LTDSSIATVTISAPKDESPGFEALIFVIALMVSILIIKKTKKR
jgi:hypothetical protein